MTQSSTPPEPQPRAFKQLLTRMAWYTDIPPPETQTLPERLLAATGIKSWPLACFAVGGGLYLIYLLIAYFDGSLASTFSSLDAIRRSLVHSIEIIYLLLVIPLVRHFFLQTITTYRKILKFNDDFYGLESESYSLNRRIEWGAVIFGMLLGWLTHTNTTEAIELPAILLRDVSNGLIFGLVGWHLYSGVTWTRVLAFVYDEVQTKTTFHQSTPLTPLIIWGVRLILILLGTIFVGMLFTPIDTIIRTPIILLYAVVIITIFLVVFLSRLPGVIGSQMQVVRALILFIGVAAVGTIGYNQLENWAVEEALYATIITMTTIGYGDFSPSTPLGRLFTIFLSLFAIGIGGFAISSLATFIIEGNFQRFFKGNRVDKQIVQLDDHYIVCGAGRMGQQVAIEFDRSKHPFVVIEKSAEVLEALSREVNAPYIQGDATEDEVLRLAGVERAKGLIAALNDDKSNVFIVLSSRSLNPDIRIISRVDADKNRKKLEKAGVDLVISPNEVSGRRMVSEMFDSEVVTFLDEMLQAERRTGQTLRLEELHIDDIKGPALLERLHNQELRILDIGQRTDLMIVAIKRENDNGEDPYIYTPDGGTILQPGDVLIVIGTPEDRLKLNKTVFTKSIFQQWASTVWREA